MRYAECSVVFSSILNTVGNFPMSPFVCRSVGRLVGWFVCFHGSLPMLLLSELLLTLGDDDEEIIRPVVGSSVINDLNTCVKFTNI